MGGCYGKQLQPEAPPRSSQRQLQPRSNSESLDSKEWYFGQTTRMQAEYLLMQPLNKCGSFLIRESESYAEELSLSVRGTETVSHYRIMEDEIKGFFLTKYIFFSSLQGLVCFYSHNNRGLTVALKTVCHRLAQSPDYDTVEFCPRAQSPVYDSLEHFCVSYV